MNDWVEVSEFPEYEIHKSEGIRRKGKELPLKGRNWIGYPKVTLMREGKKHERRVHKLVAEHFIPNPKRHPIVNHMDSDRSNHASSNLEWVDNSENQLHRWKTQKKGLKKMKYEKEYGLAKVAAPTEQRKTVIKANKAKGMLYKETDIEKSARFDAIDARTFPAEKAKGTPDPDKLKLEKYRARKNKTGIKNVSRAKELIAKANKQTEANVLKGMGPMRKGLNIGLKTITGGLLKHKLL